MTNIKWDDGLEGNSREIAEFDEGIMRVMAGPGTGKSFAISRNVQRLLEIGVPPEKIFACTFTNVAANDLEKNISGTGVTNSDKVKTSTLHSFCFSVLYDSNFFSTTGRNPRPLLDYELNFLLEDLKCKEFNHKDGVKRLLKSFKAAWASRVDLTPGWPNDALEQSFQNSLLKWLKFHKSMLLDEVISETSRYIHNIPDNIVANRFAHLIVDEYQDLNKAEQALVDLIQPEKSLLVVGDPDQAIYQSLKYSFPEGIIEFHVSHPNLKDKSLVECRRCPPVIINMANQLISYNQNRNQTVLVPFDANRKGNIRNLEWFTLEEETYGLAQIIKTTLDLGLHQPGEILVLFQNYQFGDAISKQLLDLGIPVINYFNKGILDNNPFDLEQSKPIEALALLQLLGDQSDITALRVFIGAGQSNLLSKGWKEVVAHCRLSGDDPWLALEKVANNTLTVTNQKKIQERYSLLQGKLTAYRLLEKEEVLDLLFPQSEKWTAPIWKLIDKIDLSLSSYSEICTKIINSLKMIEDPSNQTNSVRVMSFFKSKGLTSKMVVIGGILEGVIPRVNHNQTEVEIDKEIEEQRRHFYVTITRATDTLILSRPRFVESKLTYKLKIPSHGRIFCNNSWQNEVRHSQFLNQLGPNLPKAENGLTFFHDLLQKKAF